MESNSPRNPIYMKVLTDDLSFKRLAAAILLTAIPVGIAMLMQNSAMRQRIQMNFWMTAERTAGRLSAQFATVQAHSHNMYEIAKL